MVPGSAQSYDGGVGKRDTRLIEAMRLNGQVTRNRARFGVSKILETWKFPSASALF
jgi:hypothetical protein